MASIWAVGDVTDRINLTPVAIREGRPSPRPSSMATRRLSTTTWSPRRCSRSRLVGAVGMTEAEARHAFGTVDIYRSVFRPMKITFYGGQERCLIKAGRQG
ncbi:hypothetical protein ACRAWD_09790 [Caulobacter segnis]